MDAAARELWEISEKMTGLAPARAARGLRARETPGDSAVQRPARPPDLRLDPDGDHPQIRGQVFRSPTSLPGLFG
jgi:hypothetical protein